MKLYCWSHNETHHFTPGEVERIVYALTASYADELTVPDGGRPWAGEPAEKVMPCPRDVRRWSEDVEVFAEHVEQGVECRRKATP